MAQSTPDHEGDGKPTVVFLSPGYARWTFATEDPAEQQRQFSYWCGWFGFDEDDRPERVEGREWWVRSNAA